MDTCENKVKDLITEAKEKHMELRADMLGPLGDIDDNKLTIEKIKEEILKIYKKLK